MNIIIEKQIDTRLLDGINQILSVDDETFKKIIEQLIPKKDHLVDICFFYTTDKYENPEGKYQLGLEKEVDEKGKRIARFYYGGEKFSTADIFKELSKRLNEIQEGTQEYDRIRQLLNTRSLDAFKSYFSDKTRENSELLDKLFEILKNKECLAKFMDYDNNRDYFSIDGQQVDIKEYIICLGKIFGNKDKNGNLGENNEISQDFFIVGLDKIKENVALIYQNINVDRYVNPTYEFRRFTTLDRLSNEVIRKGEEPDWNISPELEEKVFNAMPRYLLLEEKAIYIYCKHCKELKYDEGYFFRGQLKDERYNSEFDKKHLEGIKPGSKITCWDFSRICSKMINGLDGDIESVIIAEGANHGHYLTGFYTDKVSVMLEAVNGRTGGTNDLMKAKNGIEFEGVEIVSDRQGIIKRAIEKVYPQVFEKKQISIKEYLQHLELLSREKDIPDNLEIKLQSFIEIMKENNITGNEAIQTLSAFYKSGFFGGEFERAYLGREEDVDGRRYYRRLVLIRATRENEDKVNESELYLIDSDSLELSTCMEQEIIEKLNSGEYVYESEKHKMPGIDKEEKS